MAFLAVGKARIALPEEVAPHTVLAVPLKASLALHSRVPSLSETEIASLLALSGASLLASQLRSLALSALILALRLRTFLALGAGSGSEAALATLSAHRGALALASHDRRG